MVKRLTVQFSDEQWNLVDKVILGSNNAEKVRNIVLSWLSEKSIISDYTKKKILDEDSKKNGSSKHKRS